MSGWQEVLSGLVANLVVAVLVSGFAVFAPLKAYEQQRRAEKLRARYRRLYPELRGLARRLVALLASRPEVREEDVMRIYNIMYTVQEVQVLLGWLEGRKHETTLMAPYPPETSFHPWRYAATFLALLSLLAVVVGYEIATAASIWDWVAILYFSSLAVVTALLEMQWFRNLDSYLDRLEEGLDYLERELGRLS